MNLHPVWQPALGTVSPELTDSPDILAALRLIPTLFARYADEDLDSVRRRVSSTAGITPGSVQQPTSQASPYTSIDAGTPLRAATGIPTKDGALKTRIARLEALVDTLSSARPGSSDGPGPVSFPLRSGSHNTPSPDKVTEQGPQHFWADIVEEVRHSEPVVDEAVPCNTKCTPDSRTPWGA